MNDDMIAEIYKALGSLNGKTDELLRGQTRIEESVSGHAKRLSSLEGSRRWFVGLALGAGISAQLLWQGFSNWILKAPH
jgi:hypothetical protein